MKIAIDARKLGRSGIGVYIKNIINHLAKVDHQNNYLILVNHDSATSLLAELPANFRLITIKSKIFSIAEHFELPLLLWKEKIELFHSTHYFLPIIMTCKSVVLIADIMPIVFAHEYTLPKRLFLRWMISWAIKKANALLAISNFTKQDVLRLFRQAKADKISVIPLAPDLKGETNNRQEILRKYGLTAGNYLLYVGSDKHNKNLDGLVHAYKLLKSCEYPLIMVGKINKKIKADAPVSILGIVDDKTLDCIYKNAKVFIMPSFYEGFGLPLLEAMARGVPVITSNVTATAEVADSAALLVDPNNIKEISRAIDNVVNNQLLRHDLVQRGYARAAKYSWEKAAQQTLAVYNKVYYENIASS